MYLRPVTVRHGLHVTLVLLESDSVVIVTSLSETAGKYTPMLSCNKKYIENLKHMIISYKIYETSLHLISFNKLHIYTTQDCFHVNPIHIKLESMHLIIGARSTAFICRLIKLKNTVCFVLVKNTFLTRTNTFSEQNSNITLRCIGLLNKTFIYMKKLILKTKFKVNVHLQGPTTNASAMANFIGTHVPAAWLNSTNSLKK